MDPLDLSTQTKVQWSLSGGPHTLLQTDPQNVMMIWAIVGTNDKPLSTIMTQATFITPYKDDGIKISFMVSTYLGFLDDKEDVIIVPIFITTEFFYNQQGEFTEEPNLKITTERKKLEFDLSMLEELKEKLEPTLKNAAETSEIYRFVIAVGDVTLRTLSIPKKLSSPAQVTELLWTEIDSLRQNLSLSSTLKGEHD